MHLLLVEILPFVMRFSKYATVLQVKKRRTHFCAQANKAAASIYKLSEDKLGKSLA